MNYAQIRKYDIANGEGIRTTLFVSGCYHNCLGCFNVEYQDFKYGQEWTSEVEDQFISYLKNEQICGCTILGGEPMQQTVDSDLLNLLTRIKIEVGKSIWIYSGYTYEQIILEPKRLALLKMCDVLIDGQFVESQKDLRLKFRGSSNQKIVDVQKSLAENKVVLWDN